MDAERESGTKASEGTPPVQESQPINFSTAQPAAAQRFEKVEREMTGFERATLRLAWLAFGVSVLAFGVSVLGAFFFFLQWRVMKGQQQLADKSARRQLRAYVMPTDGEVDFLKDGKAGNLPYTININAKNFGQTPAYNVTSVITVDLTGPSVPNPPGKITKDTSDDTVDLAPAQPWPGPIRPPIIKPIGPKVISMINDGSQVFDVWILLKYRDTFQWCQYAEMRLRTAQPAKNITPGSKLSLKPIYSNVSDESDSEVEDDPHKGCAENLDKGNWKSGFPFKRWDAATRSFVTLGTPETDNPN